MSAVVACAVVRDDPPRVFVAQDIDTLNWVLACHLVAKTPAQELADGEREELRRALREERWGDAVFAFIARTGTAVDVYESTDMHLAADAAFGPLELQLTPLFADRAFRPFGPGPGRGPGPRPVGLRAVRIGGEAPC